MLGKKTFQSLQTVKGQMLMIKRIPLQLVAQIAGIHHFERENPIILQTMSGGLQDLLWSIVVCERIASRDDIAITVLVDDLVCRPRVEESGNDLESLLPRNL